MSLIGSLEDLSLGDILQIISLSQKSGVLILSGDVGEGRIVFREGLVCGALIKGGAQDLHGVLVDSGFVEGDAFRHASDEARERAVPVEDVLVAQGILARERIESLSREAIEQAVIVMFQWRSGDFSFDVRSEMEPEDPGFSLTVGINAQYLAMESARRGDETGWGSGPTEDEGGEPELSAHEMFGVSPDPEPAVDAAELAEPVETEPVDACGSEATRPAWEHEVFASETTDPTEIVAMAAVASEGCVEEALPTTELLLDAPLASDSGEPVADVECEPDAMESPVCEEGADAEPIVPVPGIEEAEAVEAAPESEPLEEITEDSLLQPPPVVGATPVDGSASEPALEAAAVDESASEPALEATEAPEPQSAPSPPGERPEPIVVIDPDLPTLEWAKWALSKHFSRVHIFQRSEQGLARIRQYLVRMEMPMVLISPAVPADRLSGIVDARDFVRRLKLQSQRISVLWLCDEESGGVSALGEADGIALRPSEATRRQVAAGTATDTRAAPLIAAVSEQLAGAEAASDASNSLGGDDVPRFSPDALPRLKEVTAILSAGASRGEVLPLVIQFASESFSRVAMFMVRDQSIVGIAQTGLDRVGGPDDAELQAISVGLDECAWFRRVLERGASVVAGPTDAGDSILAESLGERAASEAYIAPIISSGQTVAFLYADNLPGGETFGDTSALEVVLHHAGLALERAVLERALAEMEGRDAG